MAVCNYLSISSSDSLFSPGIPTGELAMVEVYGSPCSYTSFLQHLQMGLLDMQSDSTVLAG